MSCCPRCNGFIYLERTYDEKALGLRLLKCINCGNMFDRLILRNNKLTREQLQVMFPKGSQQRNKVRLRKACAAG